MQPVRTNQGTRSTHSGDACGPACAEKAVGDIALLAILAEAAFTCAKRHAPELRFAMAKAGEIEFRRTTGETGTRANVVFQGRSSLTIAAATGDDKTPGTAASGLFMLVAIDAFGIPVPLPAPAQQRSKENRP